MSSERPPGTSSAASGVISDADDGYARMAAVITGLSGRAVSRQCVWQWWRRRDRTGFPEGTLTLGRTKHHRVFSEDAVTVWWDTYQHHVRRSFWRTGLQHAGRCDTVYNVGTERRWESW